MNVVVVGYGSIGARHARLLAGLGCRTAVVSGRDVDFPVVYGDLGRALATEGPEFVVVANATSRHHDTLSDLVRLGYPGIVLVEKPLFSRVQELPPLPFRRAFVAYNLRFHPVVRRLRTLLDGEQVLSVQAYAGQYLPDWRPQSDYRASYSASAEQGGGALRDLSHELDYLTWILGQWERVAALGGHFSPLEITSDDVFALMMATRRCPVVTVQLNYLDRLAHRTILVNTSEHTIEADVIKGVISVDRESESFATDRDYTYQAMHEQVLSGGGNDLCTLEEGLGTLRLIEAAQLAADRREWVGRRDASVQ